MKSLIVAVVLSFATLSAASAADTCSSKAMDKNGKPLAGAAKTANVTKCVNDKVGG
jgi:hypothetical protein